MIRSISLNQIFDGIDYSTIAKGTLTGVNDIKVNSRQIESGNMFVAIEGRNTDGHLFINDAYDRGARFFVVNNDKLSEHDLSCLNDVTILGMDNTRKCLSQIVNNFYSNPSGKFKLIGVTGTNGKTSVTTIAHHVFMKLGMKTGLIGTIDNYINNEKLNVEKTNPTTPDCVELGKIMDMFVQEKVDAAIMEVSSMALKNHRVDHCQFDIAVFTNISPEHLDDHITMEDYVNSKLLLFDMADKSVVNVDNEYSSRVLERCRSSIIKYGIKNPGLCDIYAKDIQYSINYASFKVVYQDKEKQLLINTPSEFAVYNNLAVIGICLMYGVSFETIIDILQDEIHIEGRYDVIKGRQPYTAIIDYAHTPFALENLLTSVRKNESYRKIITVFGCGGDRDKTKRSAMGKISQQLSDLTIITSDNPRTEDPMNIIEDIRKGMDEHNKNFIIIEDRKDAIEYAMEIAHTDDIVIIAGKGHEKVQELNGYSIEFSDKDVVLNALHRHEFASFHSFV